MWQRFTERARRTVFYAQEEAGLLGENYVSTEHLLLGLLREGDSTAAGIMTAMGLDLNNIRAEIDAQITRGEGRIGEDMQLTPRAKRVIDLSYDEARRLDNNYIGTEHLLLGMVREGEGLAGRILAKLGLHLDAVRQAVADVQANREISVRAASGAATGSQTQIGGQSVKITSEVFQGMQRFTYTSSENPLRQSEAAREFAGKDLVEIACLSKPEIEAIFDATTKLKKEIPLSEHSRFLPGRAMAMIFEKPSLRTRVSFETGIFHLGGHGIYLAPADISLGKRESVADVARNLERMCDIIMARVFEHEKVTDLAKYASVPVINGLSDLEHPCQALADFYTVLEKKGSLSGLKLAFVGDGNNVAHSLMLLAAKGGTNFAIGCPKGYEPNADVIAQSKAFAKESGAAIEVFNDPVEAVKDADVVYTDVWASMGQESEAEERAKLFADFQVNGELMVQAKADAIFMHCLPAHRGEEVTDEVIDSPQSVVFDEAENRLHVQKAVMALVAG